MVESTSIASIAGGLPRDTVEEFWDPEVIEQILSGEGLLPDEFAARFANHFELDGAPSLAASARDGLHEYLRARHTTVGRDVVLIAAFNCEAVAEAVRSAGLIVATYDAGSTFGATLPQSALPMLTPETLAIVVPHLYGAPVDLRPLLERCQRHGIAVVEDCSQTLGARLGGCPTGSFGDAAIFSFGYDKPISLGGGGLLLVRDGTTVSSVVGDRRGDEALLAQLCVFLRNRRRLIRETGHVLDPELRRTLYARAANAPPTVPIGPLRAALGVWQITRYNDVVKQRNANAEFLASSGVTTWRLPPGGRPAWLKQKVLLRDSATVATVAGELQRRGLRAGPFNWPAVVTSGIAEERRPMATKYVERSIDVPVHQRVSRSQLEEMAAVIREAA